MFSRDVSMIVDYSSNMLSPIADSFSLIEIACAATPVPDIAFKVQM